MNRPRINYTHSNAMIEKAFSEPDASAQSRLWKIFERRRSKVQLHDLETAMMRKQRHTKHEQPDGTPLQVCIDTALADRFLTDAILQLFARRVQLGVVVTAVPSQVERLPA